MGQTWAAAVGSDSRYREAAGPERRIDGSTSNCMNQRLTNASFARYR